MIKFIIKTIEAVARKLEVFFLFLVIQRVLLNKVNWLHFHIMPWLKRINGTSMTVFGNQSLVFLFLFAIEGTQQNYLTKSSYQTGRSSPPSHCLPPQLPELRVLVSGRPESPGVPTGGQTSGPQLHTQEHWLPVRHSTRSHGHL